MPIWKLTPRPEHLKADDWTMTQYRGEVIVRADDADLARAVASGLCGAQRVKPQMPTLLCPWGNPQLITIEQLKNSPFPREGPAEILKPSNHRDY